jgi:hypothetical protein
MRIRSIAHEAREEITRRLFVPKRPSDMCEAQRVDFFAACEGKITGRQYFAKWGSRNLTL